MSDNAHNPVLGIDLGTTYSCIARWDGREPEIYTLADGDQTLPSVVYYDKANNDYLVGKFAAKRGMIDPENVVFAVKRKMDDRNEKIVMGGKTFSPIDISKIILEKLVSDITNKFPKGVFQPQGVVVTVPYYFKAHQCRNTEEAAEKADLNVLGILQEPIAAALAYMLQLEKDKLLKNRNEKFLVFDLGGGTFDVTIFELKVYEDKIVFEVLSTGGDDRLGGLDFDKAIMDYIVNTENLGDDFNIPDNLKGDERKKKEKDIKKATHELLKNAKIAKESLAFMNSTFVAIPNVFPGKNVDIEFTLDQMNSLLDTWVDKVSNIIDNTLYTGKLKPTDVDIVIKVGGSSKLKIMSQLLEQKFGVEKIYGDINPSTCVGEGAAIYAAIQDGRLNINKEIEVQVRTSHALGVEVEDGDFHTIIPSNKKAPCEGWEIFSTDADFVSELDIDVYQGSDPKVINNSKVGTVHVTGILPKRMGELDIKVTFNVSDQQLITVIIEQKESGIYKVEKMQVA
jgi:molecular chaperone DnaK (HSP70)